jgi:hypothetical protein
MRTDGRIEKEVMTVKDKSIETYSKHDVEGLMSLIAFRSRCLCI